MGNLETNTFSGTAGQTIVMPGEVFYDHADYIRTDLTDAFNNEIQGQTSTSIGPASLVGNDGTANVGQYKIVRATGVGADVRAAQADTAVNAAGIVGVSQSAFTTAPQSAMSIGAGPTWVQFDSAPSVGDLAYLSAATAGNAQVAVPGVLDQLVPIGYVLAVSGTLGYLNFQPRLGGNLGIIRYEDVSGTASAPQSQNLPASPATNDVLSYRDTDGNASVNNITFNGNGSNINGVSSVILTASYGALTFRYNGTEWEIR